MRIAICIDFDNLLPHHKSDGVRKTIEKILQTCVNLNNTKATCEIRIYGGWYEEKVMTKLAQKISTEIQNDFPAIFRVSMRDKQICIITSTAQLAVALIEEPNHHLFSTYRRKGKPSNIRVEMPSNIGCSNSSCILPMAKKLLQTGRCSNPSCTTSSDSLVYRHEQKIVDTMLACDLIYLCKQKYENIIIVSSDDDFLPPIRTAMLSGSKVIRVHTKSNQYRSEIRIAGSKLIEMDI